MTETQYAKEELVSLAEVAKELEINKSKLIFYSHIGLIKPYKILPGRKQIFVKKQLLLMLDAIKKMQKEGKSLEEIVKMIKK